MKPRCASALEMLEARIAPAAVYVSPTTATYTDGDGDLVTVKFTKAILTPGNTTTIIVESGSALQTIDLTSVAASASGTAISVAVKIGGGDGLANVGYVKATGLALGAVSIHGDLGAIDAGTGVAGSTALASLSVSSLGALGLTTGAPDLYSNLKGNVGAVTVAADWQGAEVAVVGSLKSLSIGGSLIGGNAGGLGRVSATAMGPVKIGADLRGGSGPGSGALVSDSSLGLVTIGGSLLGGSGLNSGEISAAGDAAGFKIGSDVRGSVAGAGVITVAGTIKALTIGGSLVGGDGDTSGEVDGGFLGAVKIGGDLRGGAGPNSGLLRSYNDLTSVSLGGSLLGGAGDNSGEILVDFTLGALGIAHDLRGGTGVGSGQLNVGDTKAGVTIGGSLTGGSASHSGYLFSEAAFPSIKIGRDLLGGSVDGSASADGAGAIETHVGRIGRVVIGGSLRAGLNGGTGTLTKSGTIRAGYDLGGLTVGGSVVGSATNLVSIVAFGQERPSATADLALKFVTIGGRVEKAEILAGYDFTPGVADPGNSDAQIGPVKVGGDWIASRLAAGTEVGADGLAGTKDDSLPGGGTSISSSIASITIGGSVRGTFSGADSFRFMAERIGALKVGGAIIPIVKTNFGALGLTGDFQIVDSASVAVPPAPDYDTPKYINATTATYTDVDGDLVTVKFTKPIFTVDNVGSVLVESSTGNLTTLDLTMAAGSAAGTGISVTAKQAKNGDGFANVGYLKATGLALGAVSIHGDLGKIDAGLDMAGSLALKSLSVASLGSYGLSTGAPDLLSTLKGAAGAVFVKTDVRSAILTIPAGEGGLASLTVGGSILGGAGASSGRFLVDSIGAIKIGGDLQGGTGQNSGIVQTRGALGAVTIGGSILGGTGGDTGELYSGATMGAVKIGGDIAGAGTADRSGLIYSVARLTSLSVGGSLLGAAAAHSGQVTVFTGDLGSVKIAHDLRGGDGDFSGSLLAEAGSIGTVAIGGSLHAGTGASSGLLAASGKLGSVVVVGSLIGSAGHVATLLAGGSATVTGTTDLVIKSVKIGGAVEFGNILAGLSLARQPIDGSAQIGAVTVGHDWIAGNLTAGIENVGGSADNVNFGDSHDSALSPAATVIARISSIAIGGQVRGTAAAGDYYGFVSREIGSFQAAGVAVAVAGMVDTPLGQTGDVSLHEV